MGDLVQGGNTIFDKSGNAMYAYEEETGNELVMEDFVQVQALSVEGNVKCLLTSFDLVMQSKFASLNANIRPQIIDDSFGDDIDV